MLFKVYNLILLEHPVEKDYIGSLCTHLIEQKRGSGHLLSELNPAVRAKRLGEGPFIREVCPSPL